MRNHSSISVVVFLLLALPMVVKADHTQSMFEVNDEGWITNPADDLGTLTYQTSGGNPGGFLQIDDTFGVVNVFSYLLAPSKFTGDLSMTDEGTIMFDAILLGALIDITLPIFGNVTIEGGGDSASFDMAPNPLPTEWTTYSAPLSAATWGKTQTEWINILASVTSIRIDLEPIGGASEVVGFDNFAIDVPLTPMAAAIPTMSIWGLIAMGGLFILFGGTAARRGQER